MITGWFSINNELFFEVDLIGDNRIEIPVDVLLDTGFTGWLAINSQDIDGLDWFYLERTNMFTAQGETRFAIYAGKVRIDGQEFDIPVHVGDEIPNILLGCQWLTSRRLVVDIPEGILTLG